MKIAGTKVKEADVLDLAQRLRRYGSYATADHLEDALIAGKARIDLEPSQRWAVLQVLGEASGQLASLRDALEEDQTGPETGPQMVPGGLAEPA